jgi:hypothetical protein
VWLGGGEEPAGRGGQVRPSQAGLALDLTERRVTGQAEQPAHAIAARLPLARTARVVVVHEDLGALRERLAAHGAGILLDLQEPVELLLRQPVPGELVLTPPPTPGLGVVPEPDSFPAGGLPGLLSASASAVRQSPHSTLSTSAPRAARYLVAPADARNQLKSRIRTPASGNGLPSADRPPSAAGKEPRSVFRTVPRFPPRGNDLPIVAGESGAADISADLHGAGFLRDT